MIILRKLSRFLFVPTICCASLACSSSSSSSAPVIDSYSAPAQATADSAGNYELTATFSAHDDDSPIAKVDFTATGLKDKPIATDNQTKYTDQQVTLTLMGAPKGSFAYTFVITDAAGQSASSQQSIDLQ